MLHGTRVIQSEIKPNTFIKDATEKTFLKCIFFHTLRPMWIILLHTLRLGMNYLSTDPMHYINASDRGLAIFRWI